MGCLPDDPESADSFQRVRVFVADLQEGSGRSDLEPAIRCPPRIHENSQSPCLIMREVAAVLQTPEQFILGSILQVLARRTYLVFPNVNAG